MIIYRVHLIFSWRYILVMEEEKNKRILLRILCNTQTCKSENRFTEAWCLDITIMKITFFISTPLFFFFFLGNTSQL